jgi:hypothetical protein
MADNQLKNVNLNGNVNMSGADTVTYKPASIANADVDTTTEIDADKLEHLHKVSTDLGVDADSAPSTDAEKIIFVTSGSATLRACKAVFIETGTTTDVKFDLLRASSASTTFATLLSSSIAFTHSDADNTVKSGTISTSSLASGDMLKVKMAHSSASGAKGPFVWVEIDEGAN